MWARSKPAYYNTMKWHEVVNMEAEYDYRYYDYSAPGDYRDKWKTEKRVGVEIPSHAGNRFWPKDSLKFAETVNVMQSQVCSLCRRKKLQEAGIPKEIIL